MSFSKIFITDKNQEIENLNLLNNWCDNNNFDINVQSVIDGNHPTTYVKVIIEGKKEIFEKSSSPPIQEYKHFTLTKNSEYFDYRKKLDCAILSNITNQNVSNVIVKNSNNINEYSVSYYLDYGTPLWYNPLNWDYLQSSISFTQEKFLITSNPLMIIVDQICNIEKISHKMMRYNNLWYSDISEFENIQKNIIPILENLEKQNIKYIPISCESFEAITSYELTRYHYQIERKKSILIEDPENKYFFIVERNDESPFTIDWLNSAIPIICKGEIPSVILEYDKSEDCSYEFIKQKFINAYIQTLDTYNNSWVPLYPNENGINFILERIEIYVSDKIVIIFPIDSFASYSTLLNNFSNIDEINNKSFEIPKINPPDGIPIFLCSSFDKNTTQIKIEFKMLNGNTIPFLELILPNNFDKNELYQLVNNVWNSGFLLSAWSRSYINSQQKTSCVKLNLPDEFKYTSIGIVESLIAVGWMKLITNSEKVV